ncbi:MAG: 3-hydroxyacyl-ACP dehydratase FabZ [Desulfovibrio sp.]|jgi:3-hydroxyacyl-[acyl-carrier-protein] dehydratase|nr:3-hydroxyacyl-ACP dehydratase FabZ [Desulfovibrio sp.]
MTQYIENDALGRPIDVRGIMDFLPHRYPFLLVDRIVSREAEGKKILAYKNVSINEPFFQGHFPGRPIMPGVLIIEALAQAGAFLIIRGLTPEQVKNSIFLFTGIDKVRFRKLVTPGDRLDLECVLLRHKMRLWRMHGIATVDGQNVAEADLTAVVAPRDGADYDGGSN